jgi:hypothetical protein
MVRAWREKVTGAREDLIIPQSEEIWNAEVVSAPLFGCISQGVMVLISRSRDKCACIVSSLILNFEEGSWSEITMHQGGSASLLRRHLKETPRCELKVLNVRATGQVCEAETSKNINALDSQSLRKRAQ